MNSLFDAYTKYDEIIKFSAFAFTGWLLSWVLFFIMFPFMVRVFGKVNGAAINYGFSWISMLLIIVGLEFRLGTGKLVVSK